MLQDIHKKTALLFLLGLVGALGATAAVYWPGLAGPFMLDDGPNIAAAYVSNPDWDAIVYTITHNGSGLLGRSISMLSFILTGMQYGLDTWGYKYHNLILHLLNGVLLLRLMQVLLPLLDTKLDERRVLLIAGVTTALWLLHPLLVSTVLYAVQRMTQLAVLFTLLAVLAYLKARTTERLSTFYLFGWLVFPLMGLLSVLSKENGALLPFYLLAIELFAFKTGLDELKRNRRVAAQVVTFVLLPLLALVFILPFLFERITDYGGRTFTLQGRLLTQVHVILFYVQLIFLPRIRAMSLFHDDFPVTANLDAGTLLLILLLAGTLVLAWRMRKSWAVVSFGISWFFISHLMESTIVPLELVFEHRNYLASAGLLLLPVYAVFKTEAFPALRWLCPVLIALFAFMTATRAAEWGDADVFHRIAVQEHPTSGRALNTYVNYLTGKGEYEESIRQLEKLAALTPREGGVHLHMQSLKCAIDLPDHAAMARARELFSENPLSVYGYNSLQNMLSLIVSEKCPVLKIEDIEPVIAAALGYADTRDSDRRPYLVRLRGLVALYKGFYAQGYSDFRTAHELLGDISLLHELTRLQLERGEIADAEETLALMEQQNILRFGVDEHQLKSTREMVERARREREEALQKKLEEVQSAALIPEE